MLSKFSYETTSGRVEYHSTYYIDGKESRKRKKNKIDVEKDQEIKELTESLEKLKLSNQKLVVERDQRDKEIDLLRVVMEETSIQRQSEN
jgi:hypothetical protein